MTVVFIDKSSGVDLFEGRHCTLVQDTEARVLKKLSLAGLAKLNLIQTNDIQKNPRNIPVLDKIQESVPGSFIDQ
jgi:hypothetical protein